MPLSPINLMMRLSFKLSMEDSAILAQEVVNKLSGNEVSKFYAHSLYFKHLQPSTSLKLVRIHKMDLYAILHVNNYTSHICTCTYWV